MKIEHNRFGAKVYKRYNTSEIREAEDESGVDIFWDKDLGCLTISTDNGFGLNPDTAQIKKDIFIKAMRSLYRSRPFKSIKMDNYFEGSNEEIMAEILKEET